MKSLAIFLTCAVLGLLLLRLCFDSPPADQVVTVRELQIAAELAAAHPKEAAEFDAHIKNGKLTYAQFGQLRSAVRPATVAAAKVEAERQEAVDAKKRAEMRQSNPRLYWFYHDGGILKIGGPLAAFGAALLGLGFVQRWRSQN